MTELDIDLKGIEIMKEKLRELEDDVSGGGTWYIGTGVYYSIFP